MMTCVYSISSCVDLHLQQLRRAANAAQRVLDLVRQVADQLLVGLRLVDQALFAVLPGLLLQRQQLDDRPRPASRSAPPPRAPAAARGSARLSQAS